MLGVGRATCADVLAGRGRAARPARSRARARGPRRRPGDPRRQRRRGERRRVRPDRSTGRPGRGARRLAARGRRLRALRARSRRGRRTLPQGSERAHSVIADGHKWLNVPYDCGFAFVRDAGLLAKVFSLAAAYLPDAEPEPTYGYLKPESSHRARALAVWAALRAWGRSGYREMVERHLDLAQRLAGRVDEAPDLERLADVPLNIVCFRFRPEGVPEEELDASECPARRGGARRRTRLRGDDELRRKGRFSPRHRQLADARERHRPFRRGRPRARRLVARSHKVGINWLNKSHSAVTNSPLGLLGCGRIRCLPWWPSSHASDAP